MAIRRNFIISAMIIMCFLFVGIIHTETASATSLKGKTVLVEGDSIQTKEFGQYLTKAAKQMGAKKVVNKSKRGATLAYNPKGNVGNNSVYYRINKMSKAELKKYNVFIIAAGTNDWYYWSDIKLGKYNKNDTKTYLGAANAICDKIWSANNSARIIFVSPIYRYQCGSKTKDCDKVANNYGYTLMDYRCGLYNVAAWHGANIVCGDHISKKSEAKKKKYLRDYLHPTESYSNTLAKRAKSKISAIR